VEPTIVIAHDHHALDLNAVKDALRYQPKDRFLVEYLGTWRHTKLVFHDDKILAWASYEREDSPEDLASLNLPMELDLEEMGMTEYYETTAHIIGKNSKKDRVFNNFSRNTLLNLAKYGSWLNGDEIILQMARKNRFDAVRFVEGRIKEKRGLNYHEEYKDTLDWLRFDHKVMFSN
jgi:hypothetical protein